MKIKIIIFVLFIFITGCKNKKDTNVKAAAFNKRASDVFKNNPYNNDSLMYAISLFDSAISIEAGRLSFYFNKCQVSMNLKRYDLTINSCNNILSIDRSNFLATFLKGIAYELSNNPDSALNNYNLALRALESTQFEKPIFKEHQRILLYGLLKDTLNFNSSLNQFKDKFDGNNEFSAYYEDLVHFDRTNYINSY